ncbi:MAG TPA: hypothetical protein VGY77_08345 [Gemmataceae bacterium]|jgi:lysylphosphatidylglycerol synthetase-like protein (DUF2156 family)|nr:hypothetical protein [Gemmataceae bacterium]
MALLVPPPAPPVRVALEDHDRFGQLRIRLKLMWWTALTILVTTWICLLSPAAAIIALVVAKHILVAILAMWLGVDNREPVKMS